MRSEWVSKNVDIAPGHRILITEFITKVRNIMKPKTTLPIKRKQNYVLSEPAKKKYPDPSTESNVSDIAESNTTDLADVRS